MRKPDFCIIPLRNGSNVRPFDHSDGNSTAAANNVMPTLLLRHADTTLPHYS
jgi:hypothetical protein